MKVAIIDADLIGRTKHRFPNLACMKISGYYKEYGYEVTLKTNYENLLRYDKVFISKVFTDTYVEPYILMFPNVQYGGTGFFYDMAEPLPYEIEHHFPDYHLYDGWISEQVLKGKKRNDFKYYFDYSIGFITRGCFRKCSFCVNQKYDRVFEHSPLEEFYDPTRKKICLLDDNFFGCMNWKTLLQQLKNIGKPFVFKQGLDERILTDEKCKMLFSSKYDGQIFFAFDNIEDYKLIEEKLKMIRRHTNKIMTFYVLCGFDRQLKYDDEFWEKDMFDLFARIDLLMKYKCLPYIMRYERYTESPYRGTYISVARYCNQPSLFKKLSFNEFIDMEQKRVKKESSSVRYRNIVREKIPELEKMFFNIRW